MAAADEDERWHSAVTDPEGIKARRQALHELILLMGDIIDMIEERALPDAEKAEQGVLSAVRLVAHASVSLIDGVTQVLPENGYAAAALVRQMVEVEYLAWTCAHDSEEVFDWMTSTREQRLGRWQPRHMRKRAGGLFDEADYRGHCELGGHPTPVGILALHGLFPKAMRPAEIVGTEWYEAVLHSMGTVGHLATAVAARHPKLGAAEIRARHIREEWIKSDPAVL